MASVFLCAPLLLVLICSIPFVASQAFCLPRDSDLIHPIIHTSLHPTHTHRPRRGVLTMQSQNPSNPNNDVIVPNSPTDTVSQLVFSPTSNFLCATSWNKEVAIYDVQGNGSTALKGKVAHSHPVLCADWSGDGSQVVSGGSDNQARCWNLSTNQEVIIGQHTAPIKSIHYVKELNVVVTGSFDKTVKYWDMRQQQPACNIQLNERVYTMDVKEKVMAVATATVSETVVDRGQSRVDKKNKVFVYDLTSPNQPFRTIDPPLKFQHRCLQIFPDKRGFAVGSVEGRVAISHFQEKDNGLNFACQKTTNTRHDNATRDETQSADSPIQGRTHDSHALT